MKNINSFKAIERAIIDESKRQIELLEAGGRVIQETRKWDDNKGRSFSMRTKENAQDYRYFPEPNIPPILISEELLGLLQSASPSLVREGERYIRSTGLDYDAGLLTEKKRLLSCLSAQLTLFRPQGDRQLMLGDRMYR